MVPFVSSFGEVEEVAPSKVVVVDFGMTLTKVLKLSFASSNSVAFACVFVVFALYDACEAVVEYFEYFEWAEASNFVVVAALLASVDFVAAVVAVVVELEAVVGFGIALAEIAEC